MTETATEAKPSRRKAGAAHLRAVPSDAAPLTPEQCRALIVGDVFDPVQAGLWSEVEIAEAFAIRLRVRDGVRYEASRGTWLVHDHDDNGQPVWKRTGSPKAGALGTARSLVQDRAGEFAHGAKGDAATEAQKRAAKLRDLVSTGAGVERYAKLLVNNAGSPRSPLFTTAEQIDRNDDPRHLWAGDTLWDLAECADGVLQPVVRDGAPVTSADVVHLRNAACEPDRFARVPNWDALLWAMSDGDPLWIDHALNVAAVALTGYSDRVVPLFWGERGRGKTLFMSLILDLLGSYGKMMPAGFLDPYRGVSEAHMVNLEGLRGAGADEAFQEGYRAAEHLKGLTGGAKITAAAKFEAPITFTPRFTIMATSNYVPPLNDPAVRARLRPIEFKGDPVAVKRAASVLGTAGQFSEVWKRERPGVLADLMARAGRYLADSSVADTPKWLEEQLDDLAEDQDLVGGWLAQQTTDGEAPARDLYVDFVQWCKRGNVTAVPSMSKWGRDMTKAGYDKRKTGGNIIRPRALKVCAD